MMRSGCDSNPVFLFKWEDSEISWSEYNQKKRDILGDDVMEYPFQEFGSSDTSSFNGDRQITRQPGMRRVVAFFLYGFLVLLLLILLMVTGIKFSQLNKQITDVKLHLEKINHGGGASLSNTISAAMHAEGDRAPQKVRGTCMEGWLSFQRNCYLLSTSTVTWSKAEELCKTHRGHLLVLNNVEELDYISTVVDISHHYWIGLVERHHEGEWTWVDGTDFDSTPTFWDEGQPDNWHYRSNGEDCGQLHASGRRERKLWNDADCSMAYRYICESRA